MGIADLHIHSVYSHDSTSSLEVVLAQAARHANLDVIAMTDHDRVEGGLRAMEIAPLFGVQVIPGCEISTRDGHLLALFIEKPVVRGLSLEQTLDRVATQGGVCIAPHPMAPSVSSLDGKTIHRALQDADLRQILIAIETINAGLPYGWSNRAAHGLCMETGLASVGSSDSLVNWTIGLGITEFPGRTSQDLRNALLQRSTRAWCKTKRKPVQVLVSHGYHLLLRRMGWAVWTSSPGAPYRLRPLIDVKGAQL